jgi:hypothetical protein
VAVDVESVTAVGSLMIGVVPFVVRNVGYRWCPRRLLVSGVRLLSLVEAYRGDGVFSHNPSCRGFEPLGRLGPPGWRLRRRHRSCCGAPLDPKGRRRPFVHADGGRALLVGKLDAVLEAAGRQALRIVVCDAQITALPGR